jgi:hypothetical protein
LSCDNGVSFEALVAYWAGDTPSEELERLEEHLMACDSCTATSARVAELVAALRALVPPVVKRELLDAQRARGLRIVENRLAPGERRVITFPAGVDLLIHRLAGLDLTRATRVDVTVRVESTREVLFESPSAPFDPNEGVLIACQEHYSHMPPDTLFEVRALDRNGAEQTATYTVTHEFERR